jgi:para-aminobenzoate synthetase component 1
LSDLNHRQIKDTDAFRQSFTNRSQTIQSPSAVHSTSLNREQYIRAVQRAQQYIAAGDIYQVNICRIVSGHWHGDADTLARRLYHVSRAPYFCHIHLPDSEILSASPELFIDISDGTITTQPIKGTRRRSQDPRKDAQLARELTTCPKELAELIMITDLERNDLGKICRYGSVRVTELAAQKIFPHVRHLVSTITGRLRAGISRVQALFSCLPGGSITGAPKIRATEIISELEPVPRGLYCGVIGFFDLQNNAARFSIAIRTVELSRGVFRFGVGSGITADSIPAQEWEETHWKSAPLMEALGHQAEASVSAANGSNN